MNILKEFDERESKEIESRWMSIFCKNKQGFNTKAYRWHIFSGKGYPSVDGDEAELEYERHIASKYIVMPNDGDLSVLVGSKPQDLNFRDVYVFPENMAWTMAFTHEEGWLGPYFAKHPNYEQLEKENEAQRLKLKQIAYAKSKGWC